MAEEQELRIYYRETPATIVDAIVRDWNLDLDVNEKLEGDDKRADNQKNRELIEQILLERFYHSRMVEKDPLSLNIDSTQSPYYQGAGTIGNKITISFTKRDIDFLHASTSFISFYRNIQEKNYLSAVIDFLSLLPDFMKLTLYRDPVKNRIISYLIMCKSSRNHPVRQSDLETYLVEKKTQFDYFDFYRIKETETSIPFNETLISDAITKMLEDGVIAYANPTEKTLYIV